MTGWLVGGGLAPVTIGFLSEHVGLRAALGYTAGVYILGGVLLVVAARVARKVQSI
jgi:hypothetical protein